MSTPANPTTGIELKLNNGQVIKAESIEEALKTAVKMVEDSTSYARETNKKLEDLQGQFSVVQAQVAAATARKEPSANGFDKDRYYQLLHDDPLAAANYVDQVRYGVEDPVRYLQTMDTKLSALEGSSLAAGFQAAHPEFPSDEDSARTMTARVIELTRQGHPADFATMELAWSQLVTEDKLKPMETEEANEEPPPPSPGGAGGVIPDAELQKVEKMTDAELQAYLRSKGMLG